MLIKTLCAILGVTFSVCVVATPVVKYASIDHFNQINDFVDSIHAESQELCVVYDMDNTIVTNDANFGGDHWASWNNNLPSENSNKLDSWGVSKDFHSLEGALRMLMTYRLTESNVLSTINKIKDEQNHPSIVMTARGFERYYAATENELTQNKLNFTTNPIGITGNSSMLLTITPNIEHNSFKAYYNGVYYTARDNKGGEIQNLILQQRAITNNNSLCKNIVFIDNSENNVNNVYNEFLHNNKINANLTAIHYTYDRNFTAFDHKPEPSWLLKNKNSAASNLKSFITKINNGSVAKF